MDSQELGRNPPRAKAAYVFEPGGLLVDAQENRRNRRTGHCRGRRAKPMKGQITHARAKQAPTTPEPTKAAFDEQGFVALRGFLDPERSRPGPGEPGAASFATSCRRCREEHVFYEDKNAARSTLEATAGAGGSRIRSFHRLMFGGRFEELARSAARRPAPSAKNLQYFCKPPGVGKAHAAPPGRLLLQARALRSDHHVAGAGRGGRGKRLRALRGKAPTAAACAPTGAPRRWGSRRASPTTERSRDDSTERNAGPGRAPATCWRTMP